MGDEPVTRDRVGAGGGHELGGLLVGEELRDGFGAVRNVAVQDRGCGFSAKYKLAILGEYDHLSEPGAKGALLRREGLYSSHLV